MKKSFSLHRLAILISLDFSQKWKNYAWTGLLLTGCTLLMLLPPLFFDTYDHLCQLAQYAAIPFLLMFGSSFYSSTALADYTGGSKGIFALMVPASTAEKTISSLVVNLAFLVPFLVFFWQLHYAVIVTANEKIPTGSTRYITVNGEVVTYVSYCYFMLHSIIFVGSIYFSKLSYVKTLACLAVGTLGISVLNTSFAKLLADYPLMLGAMPFAGWSVVRDSSLKVYHISAADIIYPWQYLLPSLLIFGLSIVGYLRLREKQI